MSEHTPTPWNSDGYLICDDFSTLVARGDEGELGKEETLANVAFIVKAVNAYDKLVSALKIISEHLDPDSTDADQYRADDPEGAMDTCYSIAHDAIAEDKA